MNRNGQLPRFGTSMPQLISSRWAASPESGIEEIKSIADIQAVGHRVVHGGERFKQSVLITDEVVRAVEDCIDLAPLHNPANLTGCDAFMTHRYPNIRMS